MQEATINLILDNCITVRVIIRLEGFWEMILMSSAKRKINLTGKVLLPKQSSEFR